jgi:hypothetical protein
MNALEFMWDDLNKVCHFHSIEGDGTKPLSKSELKRWFKNGVIQCNGEKLEWNEEMDFPIISFVLFPNNKKRRCTLF